jgi:predicted ATPase/signal transduction histidine kinase
VAALHDAGCLHLALRPGAFFLGNDAGGRPAVRLAALGDAVCPGEPAPEVPLPVDEAALPYAAPERLGSAAGAVDRRADLYALGAVVYERLTGARPFVAADRAGWRRAHLTAEVPPAHERRPELPPIVSAILARLLAKEPDERYQTARGLADDLERAAGGGDARGGGTFVLGRTDQPGRFVIPRRLYGRQREREALSEALERAVGGHAECVLVSGPAGSGKTALVESMRTEVLRRGGILVTGQAEEARRDVPHDVLRGALAEIVHAARTFLPDDRRALGGALARVLGGDGQLLLDLVPEAEPLIGPQPSAPAWEGAEARRRLREILHGFLCVMARCLRPIVIFLDDLQWVDPETLARIPLFTATAPVPGLVVVAAWRTIDLPDHPGAWLAGQLEAAARSPVRLELQPLDLAAVRTLVADTLRRPEPEVEPLAAQLLHRSGGSPFFLRRLAKMLHHDGAIFYDEGVGRWRWNTDAVAAVALGDDILELLRGRITRLPASTAAVLGRAACLGRQFEVGTLASAGDETPDAVGRALEPAVAQGLVEVLPGGASFRFVHDRILEACGSLLPEAERAAVHLQLGRVLSARQPSLEDDRIFEVVRHWNAALGLLGRTATPDERTRVAELELLAGRRARRIQADEAACRFFGAGVSVLGDEGWKWAYDLTLALHLGLAEAEQLAGRPEAAEAVCARVVQRARTTLDAVPAQLLRLRALANAMRLSEAVDLALEVLGALGHAVRFDAGPAAAMQIIDTVAALGRAEVSRLEGLPVQTSPVAQAALRLLATTLPAMAMARPEAYLPALAYGLELTLAEGMTPETPVLLNQAAVVLTTADRQEDAYALGLAATKVQARFPRNAAALSGLIVSPVFVQHWREPVRDSAERLELGVRWALELGDVETWGYCLNQAVAHRWFAGTTLVEFGRICESAQRALVARGHILALAGLLPWAQLGANLRREAERPERLTGAHLDEVRALEEADGSGNVMAVTMVASAAIANAVLNRDPAHALRLARQWEAGLAAGANCALFSSVLWVWYRALAELATLPSAPEPRGEVLDRLAADRGRLARWVSLAPRNHEHRLALLDAELARAHGRTGAAFEGYDRAATLARENGFGQDAAFALELAADFHVAAGRDRLGVACAAEAAEAWLQYGAHLKVRRLRERFSGLDAPLAPDLTALARGSRAVAEAPDPATLLQGLLDIALEAVGAHHAVLLMAREPTLTVVAESWSARAPGPVLVGVPLDERPELDAAVIRYVARTGQTVVQAGDEDPAASALGSPTIGHPGPILCEPVRYQSRLLGVLFFEGEADADMFSREQRAAAELLTGFFSATLAHTATAEAGEAARRRVEALLATGVEHLPVGFLVVDAPDAKVRMINPALRRLLTPPGAPADGPAAARADDLLALLDARPLLSAIETGRVVAEREVAYRRGTGDDLRLLASAAPVRAADGNVEAAVLIVSDVTASRRTELDLQRRVEELAQANADLEAFSYTVSRDLRRPIFTIHGLAEVVLDDHGDQLDDAGRDHLRRLAASAARMSDLVEDLPEFSRLSRTAIRREPVDLAVLAGEVIETLRQREPGRVVTVQMGRGLVTTCDRHLAHVVLDNLLANAWKFTRTRPHARIEFGRADAGFYVRDDGIGFESAFAGRAFRAFERLHASEGYEGSGVGLATVRRIVERHGGRVWAEAEPGAGATFWFTFEPHDTPLL